MGSVLDKKIKNAGGSTVQGGDLDLLKQTAKWFKLKKAEANKKFNKFSGLEKKINNA